MRRLLLGLFLMLVVGSGSCGAAFAADDAKAIAWIEAGAMDENYETEVVLHLRGGGRITLHDIVFVVDGGSEGMETIRTFYRRVQQYGVEEWSFAVISNVGGFKVLKDFSDNAEAFFAGDITEKEWGGGDDLIGGFVAESGRVCDAVVLGGSGFSVSRGSVVVLTGSETEASERVEKIWKKLHAEEYSEGEFVFEIGAGVLANGDDYGFEYVAEYIGDVEMRYNGDVLKLRKQRQSDGGIDYWAVAPRGLKRVELLYRREFGHDGLTIVNGFMVRVEDFLSVDDELEIRFRVRLALPRDERWGAYEDLSTLVCKNAFYKTRVGGEEKRIDLPCGDFAASLDEMPVLTGVESGDGELFGCFALIIVGGVLMAFKT